MSNLSAIRMQLMQQMLADGIVQLRPDEPFLWASGYYMPIYTDNRKLLASAKTRALIGEAFQLLIQEYNLVSVQHIIGIATGGIAYATTLADALSVSLSYVRSASKDHGTKQLIEGMYSNSYNSEHAIVVEDLIATGSSALHAVIVAREYAASVLACFSIFSYDFSISHTTFAAENCLLYSIITYPQLIAFAYSQHLFTDEQYSLLQKWHSNPFEWFTNKK